MPQIFIDGDVAFMLPLTLLLIINIGLVIYIIIKKSQRNTVNSTQLELVRQIGGLALAFGVLATVHALFLAFGSISESRETLPLEIIMGGLRAALVTAVYGLIIFTISLLAFIGIKAFAMKSDI